MVAIQEDVPVVPVAVYGTQFWRLGNFEPCSVAFGEPIRFEGLPKGGRGYKEATAEIERRINVLFDWLAEIHDHGRPARRHAAAVTETAPTKLERHRRHRRVSERRQVDARQPADGDARRRSCTRRTARRATARSSSASGTAVSSC